MRDGADDQRASRCHGVTVECLGYDETFVIFAIDMGATLKRPTDDQILTALCCGPKCEVGPNTGYCHQWDFSTELMRLRALLDNMESEHARDQDR